MSDLAEDLTIDRRRRRLAVQEQLRQRNVDLLLVSAGTDLRYLAGLEGSRRERLTCLAVPADGSPVLVVPSVDASTALAVADDIEVRPWSDGTDPLALTASLLPAPPGAVIVDDHMWTVRSQYFATHWPTATFSTAGSLLEDLRVLKSPPELRALEEAAAAIDRVHARVPSALIPGITEAEAARSISQMILDEGHTQVDFVIVAAGANAANPHHRPGQSRIIRGEPVIVDIGGTTAHGYASDVTRNYVHGAPADSYYLELLDLVELVQQGQRDHVVEGSPLSAIDGWARQAFADAGVGDLFTHRTGHGIGLDTHEEPYVTQQSDRTVAPGMAFSIEPGLYLPGRFGIRIEDIVACDASGTRPLNHAPRSLISF